MQKFFFMFFLTLSFQLQAQRQKIDPISIGSLRLAEERMKIDLSLFHIRKSSSFPVTPAWIVDSLQWVRLNQVLLLPRALMEIRIEGEARQDLHLEYAGQKVIPIFDPATGHFSTRIFVSLFESYPINVYRSGELVNSLRVKPDIKELSSPHLIDYSCSKFNLRIEGLENDFLSIGCQLQRTGRFGEEKPYLEVFLTSATHRLKDQSETPYTIIFHESGEARVELVDPEGNEESIILRADLPPRLHRLRLAAGLGPYYLRSSDLGTGPKEQLAPTIMLYGNFNLNDTASIRFFDSYSRDVSTFHNWGGYYAWELAEFCDRRCSLTSLIGVQGIYFKYNSHVKSTAETILPQGFELVFKHPFGKENYIFSYGMFTSLSTNYDYQNIWIRYGKGYFWELNYIEWKRGGIGAAMTGLSVGFPIGAFF
jgi:hypothetical protein